MSQEKRNGEKHTFDSHHIHHTRIWQNGIEAVQWGCVPGLHRSCLCVSSPISTPYECFGLSPVPSRKTTREKKYFACGLDDHFPKDCSKQRSMGICFRGGKMTKYCPKDGRSMVRLIIGDKIIEFDFFLLKVRTLRRDHV